MKTAMEHINQAFGHLSRISVSGDNLDRLAIARQELRMAYGQMEALAKEAEDKAQEAEEVDKHGENNRQTAENAERGQHQ